MTSSRLLYIKAVAMEDITTCTLKMSIIWETGNFK